MRAVADVILILITGSSWVPDQGAVERCSSTVGTVDTVGTVGTVGTVTEWTQWAPWAQRCNCKALHTGNEYGGGQSKVSRE